jgi:undecaprenyl-diphosphatase
VLGGIFFAAAMLLAFGRLADEMVEGDTAKFDQSVLLALRNPADSSDPIGPAWLEEAARDITSLGSYPVLGLVVIAVIFYLLMTQERAAALWVSVSVGGGVLLSNALKFAFDRPRPDMAPALARVFTTSFPSGHATLSAVSYLTLGALLASLHTSRRLKIYFVGLALALTIAIGVSRVYLGVHYPSDVLAGWCIGAAWAALCWTIARWLQVSGRIEPPRIDAADEGN